LESDLLGDAPRPGSRGGNTGRLLQANYGSLLLVDVGELGQPLQEGLLRFLTTGEFHHPERPVRIADVRIIASTTRPLFDRVATGEFSADLYYRLNVIHVWIPPLRDRGEEIPSMTADILRDLSRQHRTIAPRIAPAAMRLLQSYDWPGNGRELRAVLEALHVSAQGATIEPDDLPPAIARRLESHVRTPAASGALAAPPQ
jgi:DNA-binding NtrC family response regulator